MFLFLGIFLAIIVAAVAIVIIYFFYYSFRINKQLKNPQGEGKHMPSPAIIGAATIIGVIFAGYLAMVLFYPWNPGVPQINDQYEEQCDLKIYTPQEMNDSYLRQFSPESNIGYEKYEEVVNDIRFTYFISQEPYDTLHPNFIAYIKYVGTKNVLTYGLTGVFYTEEDPPIGDVPIFTGLGEKTVRESDAEEYLCVVGNTSASCNFTLSIYYHDTEEAPYDPDVPEQVGKHPGNSVAEGYIRLEFNQ